MQTREFGVAVRGNAIDLSGAPSGLLGYKYVGGDGQLNGTFFEWNWDGKRHLPPHRAVKGTRLTVYGVRPLIRLRIVAGEPLRATLAV
jgi:hypothetical protein